MAWLEVHQTLQRHPKLLRLSAKLRIHRAQSAGHLLFLWLWSLDYAPTGDLSAFGPAEISAAAEYPGDAELFAQALRDTGWIDKDGKLHDWYDYAGKLIEKREADRERKAEERKNQRPPDVQRTSNGQRSDGAGTVPNRTEPNTQSTIAPEELREAFDAFRKAYPGQKRGLDPELANFTKKYAKRIPAILPLLLPAAKAYAARCEKDGIELKYRKHLQTWINNECWTEEAPPPKAKPVPLVPVVDYKLDSEWDTPNG
jgi:hypothetical protein